MTHQLKTRKTMPGVKFAMISTQMKKWEKGQSNNFRRDTVFIKLSQFYKSKNQSLFCVTQHSGTEIYL